MTSRKKYADVILPLPLKGPFTYKLPEKPAETVLPGMRAIVQFGAKKLFTAIVSNVHDHPPVDTKTKEIIDFPDKEPLITGEQLEFWEWMAGYYMCAAGEVFRAALPGGLRPGSETRVSYEGTDDIPGLLAPKEKQILEFLKSEPVSGVKELSVAVGLKNPMQAVHSLLEKGLIQVVEKLNERYRPKQEVAYALAPGFRAENELRTCLDKLQKAPRQNDALENFLYLLGERREEESEWIRKSLLLKSMPSSQQALESLVKKGILLKKKQELSRLERVPTATVNLPVLTEFQKKAFSEIKIAFKQKDTILLHGVTSSGKTEIYAHLIREMIDRGKQVLYLLPEIALTSQIINRLEKYFGSLVGVYHSKYSDAERVEIWKNLSKGASEDSFRIILGVRSSVFLPFQNLGLVIVDEENEPSYKQQDPAPRYHARDAAIYLARLYGAKTLLGTATPSLESYYNAQTGKYGLVHLAERFGDLKMPDFILVNSREAYRKRKMTAHFTPELFQEVSDALNEREQVILFQNRRGFSPYIQCTQCGWIPHCKHCDVNLTYHKFTGTLTCHYCGYSESLPGFCPECGAPELKTKGFGTEQIEEETSILFPEARIARLDFDTTRRKKSCQNILRDFEDQKIDILIGTQMISRGLDFDHVRLVGVMNADNLMFFPDFRSYERTFQLLTQVGGRAGRRDKRGKVIIQTSDPDHPVLQWVTRGDFQKMFLDQSEERKHFKYPPFYRMIKITLKHRDLNNLNKGAAFFGRELKKVFGQRILGPQEPLINRVKQWYMKQILFKLEKDINLAHTKELLSETIKDFQNKSIGRSIRILVDVDPM